MIALLPISLAHAEGAVLFEGDMGFDSGVYVAPGVESSSFGRESVTRPGLRAAWVIEDTWSILGHLSVAAGPDVEYGDIGVALEWTPMSHWLVHPDVEVGWRLVQVALDETSADFFGWAPWAGARAELGVTEWLRLSAGPTVSILAVDFDGRWGAGVRPGTWSTGGEAALKFGVF